MADESNSFKLFKLVARLKKATILADCLCKAGKRHQDAQKFSREEWNQYAGILGVNRPSPETIDVTLALMAHREKPNGNPFGDKFGKE